jgi:hypothetical protein
MAGELMQRFYASAVSRKALMRRNKLPFLAAGGGRATLSPTPLARSLHRHVAISGQILHLFQMDGGIDKIARRNASCGNKRLFGLTYH